MGVAEPVHGPVPRPHTVHHFRRRLGRLEVHRAADLRHGVGHRDLAAEPEQLEAPVHDDGAVHGGQRRHQLREFDDGLFEAPKLGILALLVERPVHVRDAVTRCLVLQGGDDRENQVAEPTSRVVVGEAVLQRDARHDEVAHVVGRHAQQRAAMTCAADGAERAAHEVLRHRTHDVVAHRRARRGSEGVVDATHHLGPHGGEQPRHPHRPEHVMATLAEAAGVQFDQRRGPAGDEDLPR